MKLTKQTTDAAILSEMGRRLTKLRLDRNLSQADLAELAGISKRTVERLEAGAVSAQFASIIRICRVLDLTEQLEAVMSGQKVDSRKRKRIEKRLQSISEKLT